jgi:hypothetical protein
MSESTTIRQYEECDNPMRFEARYSTMRCIQVSLRPECVSNVYCVATHHNIFLVNLRYRLMPSHRLTAILRNHLFAQLDVLLLGLLGR